MGEATSGRGRENIKDGDGSRRGGTTHAGDEYFAQGLYLPSTRFGLCLKTRRSWGMAGERERGMAGREKKEQAGGVGVRVRQVNANKIHCSCHACHIIMSKTIAAYN